MPEPCGCRIIDKTTEENGEWDKEQVIAYCPKHLAVDDLIKVLDDLTHKHMIRGHPSWCSGEKPINKPCDCFINKAEQVLHAAEGKESK
ncbi:hypothetical protein LCGC14_3159000 [marine sediment metagenome]|uniref:Uncharacterized protein n=1 Tax=marine sediment metagenome TaxID=412755 RepID=A0A0F8YGB3_9ZZZZ